MEFSTFLFILEFIALLFSTLATVFIIILTVSSQAVNFSFMAEMGRQWNVGPMTNVLVGSYQCKSDESPLISDQWSGTVKGCTSGGIVKVYGTCGKYHTPIAQIAPKPINIWRGTNLCANRVPASYLDLSIEENEASCPTGQRQCGLIDTLNNVMCVPSNTPCPINYLQVIPNTQPSPTGFNFTSIGLINSNMIVSNISTKSKIIANNKLSESIPCINPYYRNYLIQPYLLEVYYDRSTCQEGYLGELFDNNYELKDQYSTYTIYEENNIITDFSTLPNSAAYLQSLKTSERQLGLYFKNYIGIKVKCIKLIREKNISKDLIMELIEMDTKMADISNLSLYGLIFGSIGLGLLIVQFILTCILDCGRNCNKRDILCRSIIYNFPYLFILVIFVISCIVTAKLFQFSTNFQFLIDQNCVDKIPLDAITKGGNTLLTSKTFALLSLIFSLSAIINHFVNMILACCNKD